jgi:Ni/Co efflux regulator RcnB
MKRSMKTVILAAASTLFLAGAVALPASAQQGRGNDRGQNELAGAPRTDQRNDNQRNDDRGRPDDRNNGQYQQPNTQYADRGNDNWRNDDRRNDRGNDWRRNDDRRYDARDHREWRRGDRIDNYNHRRYVEVDYRRNHLRAPPRGYHYVQDDRGDIILAALAGGLIAAIIAAH